MKEVQTWISMEAAAGRGSRPGLGPPRDGSGSLIKRIVNNSVLPDAQLPHGRQHLVADKALMQQKRRSSVAPHIIAAL